MRKTIVGLLCMVGLAACEGIDCTLNNVVALNIGFYDANGTGVRLADTLMVTAAGTDSIIFNSGTGVEALGLPMSYEREADTLVFSFKGQDEEEAREMTLIVKKTNQWHTESPDCPVSAFHHLTGIERKGGEGFIDSVVVVNEDVNYAALENIRIYLHTAD